MYAAIRKVQWKQPDANVEEHVIGSHRKLYHQLSLSMYSFTLSNDFYNVSVTKCKLEAKFYYKIMAKTAVLCKMH